MNKGYDTLAGLLEGKVKTKANKTGDLKGRVKRVTDKASEVIVKVSGAAKGAEHVKAHLDYISRNGKLELENERGEVIKGKAAVKEVHKEWTQDGGKRRANTRDTANLVLSMPKGTDPKAVRDSARDFAKGQFGDNYQYVFALHTDVDHPHVHLTIKTLGHDGRRLHIKKGDPQKWREGFAEQLQRRGIDAEATPRAPRGVVKKAVSQVIKNIRSRGEIPEVDKAKVKEIVSEFKDKQAGKPPKAKPWEDKIQQRQQEVRKSWLSAAKDLNQGDAEDRELASKIVGFVSSMPPLATERHEIAAKLAEQMKPQQKAQDVGQGKAKSERDEDER